MSKRDLHSRDARSPTREDVETWLLPFADAPDAPPDPELFKDGVVTGEALRLYLEGALSPEGMAAVDAGAGAPEVAERLKRIANAAQAREEAALRRELRGTRPRGDAVVLQLEATSMRHLFESPELRLHVAAREMEGGSNQVASADATVTLYVQERFVPGLGEGELVVRARTKGDPRLTDARGRFEVLVDGEPVAVYPVEVTGGQLWTRLAFQKLNVSSHRVLFQLVLLKSRDGSSG